MNQITGLVSITDLKKMDKDTGGGKQIPRILA